MAHFARLDSNNKVVAVHVVSNEYILDENGEESEQVGIDFLHTVHGNDDRYVQTSYNNNFRVRYAAMGYTYNESLDAFIPPKPYDSWILNTETYDWEAPIPQPEPEEGFYYVWNEDELDWDKVEVPPVSEETP